MLALLALGSMLPGQTRPAPDAEPVHRVSLKLAEIDTRGPLPAVPADLRAPAAGVDAPAWHVVQVRGPVTDTARAEVARFGIRLSDYVPEHAFLARATPRALDAARTAGAIVWHAPLHPAFRIDPTLLASSAAPDAARERRLIVHAFAGVGAGAFAAAVTATGARVVEMHDATGRTVLVADASANLARRLAALDDVQWVEDDAVLTSRNDTTAWTIQTFRLNDRRIWDQGLHGEGQVIGHMDGMIDTGSCFFGDPSGTPIGANHRKIVFAGGGGSTSSHGTHTAGTAAGDAFPVNGSTGTRGIAYGARIAHSSSYSSSTWYSVAQTHRNAGARVHTNSWGNDSTTAYNSLCNAIDQFSWDFEDNLVCFAETNTSTLKNPENAKNLIAVGNARNGTSADQRAGGGVGPTADGRLKPDLFAPGSGIVSAAIGACGTRSLSGTSMACPAVAGAAALVRQYFVDGFYPSGTSVPADSRVPSASLVKAVLINTTQDMTGVPDYPNPTEGWGRINLDESLYFATDLRRLLAVDVRRSRGVSTGQVRSYELDVTSSARPLEITLAFMDFPGTVNASNPVVNDLDLTVQAPDATLFLGNVFASGWSSPGGSADPKNNVERVAVESPPLGRWTITITARNVPQGPQGFAIAASGSFDACFDAAANVAYGTGKAGTNGVPSLASSTPPVVPSAWTLELARALPNGNALLLFGQGRATLPFDGATILVQAADFLTLPIDASGNASLTFGIPAITQLCGLALAWQAWIPNDPGAAGGGWAASNGLEMQFGH